MTNKLTTVGNHSIATKKVRTASLLGRGLNNLKSKANVKSSTDLEVTYRQARDAYNRIMSYNDLECYVETKLLLQQKFKLDFLEQQIPILFEKINTLENLVNVFQELTKKGFGKAYFPLAHIYHYRRTFLYIDQSESDLDNNKEDFYFKEAFNWCFSNKELIAPEVWFDLGEMFESGNGIKKDYKQAEYWYSKAAKYNLPEAQYRLRAFYTYFFAVHLLKREEDKKLQEFWCRKAAEQGYPCAQLSLGFTEENEEQRYYWLHEAAEKNDPEAQWTIGLMHLNGEGVKKNDALGAKWVLKSAEQNHWEAKLFMGWLYEIGKGVKKNHELEKFWHFTVSYNDPDVQYDLGVSYWKPSNRDRPNYEIAIYLFRKAADQSHAESESVLAYMYRMGLGVEQDDEQAGYWYQKAAEQDIPNAQYELGRMYELGLGIEQSDEQAVYWYQKGAEQDYPAAQYGLGRMYLMGLGVEQTDEVALIWFRKAAVLGSFQSQEYLTKKNIDWKE